MVIRPALDLLGTAGRHETTAALGGGLLGFELQGGVLDAEAVVEFALGAEDESVVPVGSCHDEMGGEGGFGCADAPDVEVVHVDDFGKSDEVGLDCIDIYAYGDSVEREVDGVSQELPGASEDDGDDGEAENGIEPRPTGLQHDKAAYYDTR